MNLVRWAGSPLGIVWRMLDLAQIGSEDVAYDLGSGDGRIYDKPSVHLRE